MIQKSRHGKLADGMTIFTLAIPRTTKAKLAELARADDRSTSMFTRRILMDYVRRSGAARKGKVAA